MKNLQNTQLTQSLIFRDYDSIIEGAITDLFEKHQLNCYTQPDLQVFNITKALPLSDPGNEEAFLIKLSPDLEDPTHLNLFEDLQKTSTQTELITHINSYMGDDNSDYLGNLETIFVTNADIFFLFTYCR